MANTPVLMLGAKYVADPRTLADGTVTFIPLDENGKVDVNATITATIADSKVKGSTDGGATEDGWVPLKVGTGGELEVTVNGSYPEIRQLSTDAEPNATTAGKGAVLYLIDTGVAKMSNGTAWVVL